jgi:tetratricopeptide (TPR) repeat protein
MPAMRVRVTLRVGVLALVVSVAGLAAIPRAATAQEDARAYNQKATAAFALGKYSAAADYFEKAFELKPDPALLYNAAQAHRMAGDKERALALYQNYLRVYGGKSDRTDVEKHIEELKKAIEHDKEVANSPPTNTEPIANLPPPAETAPPPAVAPLPAAPAPAPAAAPVTLVDKPSSADEGGVTSKPWFWVALGGAVVVVAVVAIVALSGGSKDPSPSIGVVP